MKGFPQRFNRLLIPSNITLGDIDSTGMKTHQKGTWVAIRFSETSEETGFQENTYLC